MLFHKDMLNYSPYNINEINPYVDETLLNVNKLAKDKEFLNLASLLNTNILPSDLQYPVDLLQLNELYGVSPDLGWDVNKLVSPEFVDVVKQQLNDSTANMPTAGNYLEFLKDDMLSASPYRKTVKTPLEAYFLENLWEGPTGPDPSKFNPGIKF